MKFLTRRTAIASAALLVAAGSLVAWPGSKTGSGSLPPVTLRIGDTAPAFSLIDPEGAVVTLAAYRGRVVMVNFWATWCTGCKTELPWLSEFQERYESRGLVSVGVALDDEGWAVVRPFLADHPIAYPVVAADWSLADRYGVMGLPLTLLVDRRGRVAATHLGVVDRDGWAGEIERVLNITGS